MRGSLVILLFFIAGMVMGRADLFPGWVDAANYTTLVLYVLMFFVGVGVGADKKAMRTLVTFSFRTLLIPVFTITGTLTGVLITGFFIRELSFTELLAVGSGFGYYSLSSVIITGMHSAELGVIALLSNVMREIITLLFAPLFMKFFGKLAPIAAGGATSMDTTLPIITAVSGKEFALAALFHGILLTLLVPLLVTFFIAL